MHLETAIAQRDEKEVLRRSDNLRKLIDQNEAALVSSLKAGDDDSRLTALRALIVIRSGSPPILDHIASCLKDPSAQVRRQAADGLLYTASTPRVIEALREAIHDNDSDVYTCAATALALRGDSDYLLGQLKESDVNARCASLYGLGGVSSGIKLEGERLTTFLIGTAELAINDPDPKVRREAESVLRFNQMTPSAEVIEYLANQYAGSDDARRARILEVLVATAPKSPVTESILTVAKKEGGEVTRKTAARVQTSILGSKGTSAFEKSDE